ncbi:MAG: S24/S26 family peptidase [Oscillospiraceae bacterium]|nr:S24/S26 family peptidase [Oscillospiraceae bacterium]
MGKAQLEELERHGKYFSVPKGISMKPMLGNRKSVVEIHKLSVPAKLYDLVLYLRPNDQGVIHRVLKVRENDYVIAGDNCWQKEYIAKDRVVGIAVRFCRNETWYEVNDPAYRIYVRLWTDLFFLRRPLFYLRDKLKSVKRKSSNAK